MKNSSNNIKAFSYTYAEVDSKPHLKGPGWVAGLHWQGRRVFACAPADISLNMLRFIMGLRIALNPDLRF